MRIPTMKLARFISLSALALSILACSTTNCGRKAAKVVPALEKVNPEYGTEPIDCDKPYPTRSAIGCSQGTLTCGGSIEGNTSGGRSHFGDDFYQKKFCSPERHDYDEAPEAVYTLEVPGDIQADVYLTSDCEDLDIVAMSWADTDRCPTINHAFAECEMDTHKGGGKVRLTTVNKPQTYLLAVDGKKGATANFRITVKCSTYR